MKKLIAILCSAMLTMMMFVSIVPTTLFALEGDVVINETNFPDAVFRNYVSTNFDTTKDGTLTKTECDAVKNVEITMNDSLKSLKGIEYFTNLENLKCYGTKLTTLDVSKNTALNYLDCGNTSVAQLDVSKNNLLEKIFCYKTNITELGVSKNNLLQVLSCSNTNVTKLDVSKNTVLRELYCESTNITKLDVSKNDMLEDLSCEETDITELDVSKNTMLNYLSCYDTSITNLDVSKNTMLKTLICNTTSITNLDISKNTVLNILDCSETGITKLDLSLNTELEYLDCSFCHLPKLIVPDEIKVNIEGSVAFGQTIKVPVNGMTDDGKYIVDMKTIVGAENLDKVSIIDTDEYTYNSETGIVTFLIDNPTEFTYLFDTGVIADESTRSTEETMKMDVTVTLIADYSEVEQLLSDFLLLNPEDYANYDEVRDAVVAINLAIEDNLPLSEQSTVDGYAKAIRAELDKLGKEPTPSPETTANENIMYVVFAGILMLAGATLIYKKHKEEK